MNLAVWCNPASTCWASWTPGRCYSKDISLESGVHRFVHMVQVRQNQEAAAAFAEKTKELLRAGDLASVKRAVSLL